LKSWVHLVTHDKFTVTPQEARGEIHEVTDRWQ